MMSTGGAGSAREPSPQGEHRLVLYKTQLHPLHARSLQGACFVLNKIRSLANTKYWIFALSSEA